ncbi:DUF1236 domain-containing protein [Leisingera daeponensis]|uniref:DUF1236 domain-containing protein n=1 Tax=Leisingera daeponensis TaxID=405746 RepID=A0ABS7N9G2_9RHOB|nr:DUF1236 domain-containing protein [Leisingera daeponensis]MBY6054824.1 DUF1236 domain-containing protein [Leisingera daeponensis]MBY6137832.1 DUF1236 domain-containing protein [Leisingera daeponensis]
MHTSKIALTASALALLAAPVWAGAQAQAVTDLNLRAGPGPQYDIVGVIAAEGAVDLEGCIEESNWCKVSYEGADGWAYGEYLTGNVTQEYIPVVAKESPVQINTVTYEKTGENDAELGAVGGAITGGLIAGPAGVVAGAIAGAAAGEVAVPDEEVVTYVRSHATEPVYVQGEVVTGVMIPEEVELTPVPESDYRYVYLNGLPVLVEADSRTVIHVVR